MIEEIIERPWTKDEVKRFLGAPSKIFERKGKDDEFWTFNDSKMGHQRLSIIFSKDGLVSLVVYIPQEYEKNSFSIDAILQRWKNLKCKEKSEQRITPHVISTVNYFACDQGRKFFFNKWNEVLSIDIPVLKTQKKTP
ncbi:MAG: hypothetical protein WCG27_07030 [Pseudomonadota bacterium]